MTINNPTLTLTFLGGDVSMSTLTVTRDDIEKGSIASTFQLFSSLKSSSRQYKLTLKRKSKAVESIIRTEGDVKAVLSDDGGTLFSGYLSTYYSWTLSGSGEQDLSITIEDNGSKLLGKPFIKSGKHLFKCTAYNAVKAICDKCGIELSSSVPLISTEIVKVVSEGDACKDILTTLLYETGYVYYFENDGKMNLFSFLSLPTTESVSLDGTSLIVNGSKAITLSKKVRQYKSAKVKFTELCKAQNYLVYRNTTGQDASHKYCNLSLKPNEAFDGAEVYTIDPTVTRTATLVEAVNAESETNIVGSRDIIAIENVSAQIEKNSNISASITGAGGPYLQIEAENKSSNTYAITRLDAYADVVYEKAQGVVISGEDTDSSDNTIEEEMAYIHEKDDVEKHANLLTSYYKYSGATYTFYSRENIACGAVVKINDDVFTGLSVLVLVYAKTENDSTGMIEYKAIGYSEFNLDKTTIVQRQLYSPIKGQGQKGEKGDIGEKGEKGEPGEKGDSVSYGREYLLDTSPAITEEDQAAKTGWVDESLLSWSYGYYIYKRTKETVVSTSAATYKYLGRATALEDYYKKQLSFYISSDTSTYFKDRRALSAEETTISIMVHERYYEPDSIIWTLNGSVFAPALESGAYTFKVPVKNPLPSYTVTATPVKNSIAVSGAISSITLNVLDTTESCKFYGSVTALASAGAGEEHLDGDSCFLSKDDGTAEGNRIYVYQSGSWIEFNSSTLSDDIKSEILSKAQKAAFEYAENNELAEDYGYFKTLVAKYIYARNIGAETIALSGYDGKLVGGDYESQDDNGFLKAKGVYIDSTGVAKFTKALLNDCSIKGSSIEALTLKGDLTNGVLSTISKSTPGEAITVGAMDSQDYYLGSQAKAKIKELLGEENTIYDYSGVYNGTSFDRIMNYTGGDLPWEVNCNLSGISGVGAYSGSYRYALYHPDNGGIAKEVRWTDSLLQEYAGSGEWTTLKQPSGSMSNAIYSYLGTTNYYLACYDTDSCTMKGMYNNGRWLAEGFTGLFFANTEYVNTSAGTFWIGQYANDKYSCEGLWSVTFYYLKNNSISREGLSYYSYGNPIDTKPTFSYCGDGYGYAYYAQYSGTWYRHAVSFGDYPSVTRTAIACPANTAKVWANSGYTYAYDGSAIYFYEGMTPSSAFDWTLLCNMTFTSLLQCAEFWTVVDSVGSSNHEYIFHKRFPLLQLSDSYGYSSDFSFPIDASNKVYIFFATKILCQIRNFPTSYAAGLLLLDGATGHCIDTESSLNDYIQSQSLTLCDGGTELLNLPAAIPDGMDFYRRMPVLYGEDKMIYSISSIDIEAYTRFDVSTLQEVDMPAVTAVPETVYISPDLLKVDNVDKLNSAWYIKNKTSLVATITPNAITAGVKTGNLEPLADDNTIGAITPYKAIRVKELIDLFPVGSIYMSLKNNDPAEIFGGQWDLLPSRFLYGGSSKGNYTTGSQGGASEVTLKTENMPSHTHSCSSNGSHAHTVRVRNDGNPDGWNDRSSAYERQYWNTSYNQYSQRYNLDPETEVSGSHSHTIGASGSGTAFSILPPYQLVNIWYRSA